MRYKSRPKRRLQKLWLAPVVLLVLIAGGLGAVKHTYDVYLRPVSASQQTQIFTVDKGSSVKMIAAKLQDAHLIRSAWAFQLFAHGRGSSGRLQAGTYALSPSQGPAAILATMTKGKVTTQLITILPGRRIDQVRADLINAGFAPAEVDGALQPEQYADSPVMAFRPANNNLEGLLWPDSFQRDASTSPAAIIRQSLTAMGQHLSPDIQAAFAAQGLSPYRGLILASIVVQEVNKPDDQAQAAQVFLTRLRSGAMLGSDVTAKYGSIAAGREPSLNYDSAYNTHLHAGLPPGPISTINASSLNAAAHPAPTNWLYFVTGDDGMTHFSTNLQDHQALTEKYCHKLCSN
jgi:UPF0755 protein